LFYLGVPFYPGGQGKGGVLRTPLRFGFFAEKAKRTGFCKTLLQMPNAGLLFGKTCLKEDLAKF
jgi:hypothetical protein